MSLFVYQVSKMTKKPVWLHSTFIDPTAISGVARAFPGGLVAHPEGHNEYEN